MDREPCRASLCEAMRQRGVWEPKVPPLMQAPLPIPAQRGLSGVRRGQLGHCAPAALCFPRARASRAKIRAAPRGASAQGLSRGACTGGQRAPFMHFSWELQEHNREVLAGPQERGGLHTESLLPPCSHLRAELVTAPLPGQHGEDRACRDRGEVGGRAAQGDPGMDLPTPGAARSRQACRTLFKPSAKSSADTRIYI